MRALVTLGSIVESLAPTVFNHCLARALFFGSDIRALLRKLAGPLFNQPAVAVVKRNLVYMERFLLPKRKPGCKLMRGASYLDWRSLRLE